MNFEQPADVHWFGEQQVASVAALSDGRRQSFESVREAVRFVMEKLTATEKMSAFIQTDEEHYSIEDIEAAYESPDFPVP
jgi:hypothetical protein